MGKTTDISVSLRVATMCPLDAKSIFETLAEMKDLGEENSKAFTYYEGMSSYCVENKSLYRWQEIIFGSNGLLDVNFAYPPDTIIDTKDYSGKIFNFVLDSSGSGSGSGLYFVEPSVNIEIKDEPLIIEEAMHFGNMDIGSGLQDVALIKETFVSQSNYDIKAAKSVGDQIKIFSSTSNIYLGQFITTNVSYNGYRVLTVVEKGDWGVQAVYNTQKIFIAILEDSDYTLELDGTVVKLKQGEQTMGSADLTALLAGQAGATIVSGVIDNNTGIVTFTMSDASTFQVDFSGLISADTQLRKEGITPVRGNDIFENIFIPKSLFVNIGAGYYSADISTNYNATSIQGFPYPNSSFVVLRYLGSLFMLMRKNISSGARVFNKPGNVMSMTFYTNKDNIGKSMNHIGHFHIMTGKIELAGLNSDWWAFKVFIPGTDLAFIPLSSSSGYFNEREIIEGTNESGASCFANLAYQETVPLKKSITAPYTLKDEDNGRILHIGGAGNITVPSTLSYGFECGLRQVSSSLSEISIIAGSGVTINRPSEKENTLSGQWFSAYLEATNEYGITDNVTSKSNNVYILSGDLKNN